MLRRGRCVAPRALCCAEGVATDVGGVGAQDVQKEAWVDMVMDGEGAAHGGMAV